MTSLMLWQIGMAIYISLLVGAAYGMLATGYKNWREGLVIVLGLPVFVLIWPVGYLVQKRRP